MKPETVAKGCSDKLSYITPQIPDSSTSILKVVSGVKKEVTSSFRYCFYKKQSP